MGHRRDEPGGDVKDTPRILIVDDDEAHATSVRDLFDAYDLTSDMLHRGAPALDLLAKGGYQLLILDLDIPDLPGIEVLTALVERSINIRTIILSGESSLDNVTPILRLGAFDYIRKPYVPAELMSSVNNALAQNRLERENEQMNLRADASNQLHRFLVEASPDLIYVLDEQGRFRLVNNQLSDVLGFQNQELRGTQWQGLFGNPTHEQLQHRFDERRRGTRATHQYEFDHVDNQGRAHILELSAMGLYHDQDVDERQFAGTYGVVRNVTASRSTARQLAESQRKFYGLFMNSPDAVFISELASGQILESNATFERIARAMGADLPESDRQLWPDPRQREAFVTGLARNPDYQLADIEHQLLGEPRYFHISGRLIELEGKSAILATLRDVTNERRAQQDRLQLETQLQQASKMEAIGQLAGGIAHDFNNILASIIGYTELVMTAHQTLAPTKIDRYLGEVVSAGQRARDLISQMLTFTRAMRGNPQKTYVWQSFEDVSRMLRAAIPATIRIETQYEPDTPPVLIDPVQLQQIVINLLINARDAIDGNGRIDVCVGTATEPVTCASCETPLTGDWVELSVTDDGHGIDVELQKKIFDMYVTTREPGKGTGIGLWLIHTLVHEYGGHITLTSSPGVGTRFGIRLPDANSAAIEEQKPTRTQGFTAKQGQVLVVDDEVSVSNYIGEVLRNDGFDVRIFNDSTAAAAHLADQIDTVAVLVTDQIMPQLTGIELATQAKELCPDLPVVLITGYSDSTDMQRVGQLGIEACLKKPFRMDDLLVTLRDLAQPNPVES